MSDFDGIEPLVKLDDGQSFVGVFDRTKDVSRKDDSKYGTRYVFEFLAVGGTYDGKLVKMSGGARLHEGLAKALGNNKTVKVRITQSGPKGGLDSKVSVEPVK
jgi:hypothetical protein